MKKLIALLTVFALMGAFTACKADETNETGNNKPEKQTTSEVGKTTEKTEKSENNENILERYNAKAEKAALNRAAKALYQNAQALVQDYEENGIKIGGYYYSTDNSDYAKALDKKIKASVDDNGKKYDVSGGWAVAISTNGTYNIDPGTTIGAVVANESGDVFGRYPMGSDNDKTFPDIETAVKAVAEEHLKDTGDKLEEVITNE
jgi:hypothetical protein